MFLGAVTATNSLTPHTGTLNFPNKKKEAARIDNENFKFAKRILC